MARRSAYLALLEEQPRRAGVWHELFADSAFLAERVIAQPLLLDDVLDPRIDQLPLRRADIADEIAPRAGHAGRADAEAELDRSTSSRPSTAFRLGLAFNDGRADAAATARRLAALAEAVVVAVTATGRRELVAQHGELAGEGCGFAVLGYGSLGGERTRLCLRPGSGVRLRWPASQCMSDGSRPLEGVRWYQRLAQRVMHWLTVLTRGGRLYEVDTRLRPDGSKGLLVT